MRTDVADGRNGLTHNIALDIQIPLHLVWSRIAPKVIAVREAQRAIRRYKRTRGARDVRKGEWKLNRRVCTCRLCCGQEQRLERVVRVARVKHAMGNTQSCLDVGRV